MTEVRGKRVLVVGLGLFGGGVGAAQFLVREGAEVTVTDLRSREDLAASLHELDEPHPVTAQLDVVPERTVGVPDRHVRIQDDEEIVGVVEHRANEVVTVLHGRQAGLLRASGNGRTIVKMGGPA